MTTPWIVSLCPWTLQPNFSGRPKSEMRLNAPCSDMVTFELFSKRWPPDLERHGITLLRAKSCTSGEAMRNPKFVVGSVLVL